MEQSLIWTFVAIKRPIPQKSGSGRIIYHTPDIRIRYPAKIQYPSILKCILCLGCQIEVKRKFAVFHRLVMILYIFSDMYEMRHTMELLLDRGKQLYQIILLLGWMDPSWIVSGALIWTHCGPQCVQMWKIQKVCVCTCTIRTYLVCTCKTWIVYLSECRLPQLVVSARLQSGSGCCWTHLMHWWERALNLHKISRIVFESRCWRISFRWCVMIRRSRLCSSR